MRMAWIVTTVLFVLSSASAVNFALKARWWAAVGVFLPSVGLAAVLLGGVVRQSMSLFWLGCLLVVAGLGAEVLDQRRTRTAAK
ncbi:hypothetical protein [Streptomyces sp. NBC_00887]|uniref:hypothetical protein n=1 Tax=Streptomyces sp. NBC_00887 TaxID=2975859 RepID=UPI00386425E5|nr:hypothetical protein OG844_27610 [Streptomyces sp. NBC_00887]